MDSLWSRDLKDRGIESVILERLESSKKLSVAEVAQCTGKDYRAVYHVMNSIAKKGLAFWVKPTFVRVMWELNYGARS